MQLSRERQVFRARITDRGDDIVIRQCPGDLRRILPFTR